MLRLSRTPWIDGTWIEPPPPPAVRLRSMTFAERLRAIQVCREPHTLQFAGWWILLTLFLVGRYLIALYMTTNTFSATAGVPLRPIPAVVAPEALDLFSGGHPVLDSSGGVILDPARDRLFVVRVRPHGALTLDGEPIRGRDLDGALPAVPWVQRNATVVVAIWPEGGATYQDVIFVVGRLAASADPGTRPRRILLVRPSLEP